MELYLINNKGMFNLSNLIIEATSTGEYRSCCRELNFTMLDTININIGDKIRLMEKGDSYHFYGIVWSKNKNSNENTININCKDFGIYLKKNSYTYKFKNITPQNVTKKVCSDFGIRTNVIAGTNVRFSRNFINCNLYDIIMTSYTLGGYSNLNYFLSFKGDMLNVLEKGHLVSKQITQQANLINSSVSESLDDVVNRVDIYNDEDKIIKTLRNNNSIKLYGILNDYIKISKDDKNYMKKGQEKLKDVEKKITVTNFGDTSFRTGYGVVVQEPITTKYCTFYIDEDTHIWRNGLYTNRLVLNLKNVMDRKEDGSLEENKILKKKVTKKTTKKGKKGKKKTEDYSIYTNRLKQ